MKNITEIITLNSSPEMNSNHNPISFNMQIAGIQPASKTTTSYKSADWRDFINKNVELNTDIQDTLALEGEVDNQTVEGQKKK